MGGKGETALLLVKQVRRWPKKVGPNRLFLLPVTGE